MSLSSDGESDKADGVPHPRHATRLVGHVAQEQALLDAYRNDRLPHAVILGGPNGVGKATLAWRLAKFLLAHPSASLPAVRAATSLDVSSATKAVAQVASLSHPDVVLLRREVNEKTKRFFTEIRADDVRRAIGLFQRAAGAGGFRICIVDSAENLNRSSANALLKLIEEPPPASLFVLIAHRPGLVIPTIRSRARLIRFDPLAPGEIAEVVGTLGAPWSDMSQDAVAAAAAQAQGSVQDAIRLLAHRGPELRDSVGQLLDRLPAIDWREVHKLADAVTGRDGEDAFETALTAVFDWLAFTVRSGTQAPPRRLAPYAEVWEKIAHSARETDALNLDKRPLILSIFSDLAAAVRASSA
jgi:DNA polymerase-3 subunit delta'